MREVIWNAAKLILMTILYRYNNIEQTKFENQYP